MVCHSQLRPGRLVSLLEITRVYAERYIHLGEKIDVALFAMQQKNRDVWTDATLRPLLMKHMEMFDEVCVGSGLAVTRIQVGKIACALQDPCRTVKSDLLCEYLKQLSITFSTELQTKIFLQIPSEKMRLFDAPYEGWEEVIDQFPDTISEIEEMSKCFALSRYGASVFHSLLIVEVGLIELGKAIKATDPKVGWDATTRRLSELVKGGHAKYPTDLPVSFGTCEQINQRVETMKHAWRNKVNHFQGKLTVIRTDFAPDTAEEIMVATRGFMRTLATDLKHPSADQSPEIPLPQPNTAKSYTQEIIELLKTDPVAAFDKMGVLPKTPEQIEEAKAKYAGLTWEQMRDLRAKELRGEGPEIKG